jgi:hypothetical protein
VLDLRIYRAALAPFVLVVLIVGFALGNQPTPAVSTLAPDAFDGARAFSDLTALASSYPDRRPGGTGDQRLARLMSGAFANAGFQVRTDSFSGRTVVGTRTLQTVVAVRTGTHAGAIVLVAHRDAASSPSRVAGASRVAGGACAPAAHASCAELSGTAALLELAHVFSGRVTQRTIVLASTSGGSGGDAGAADLARTLNVPVDAVIVLGDVAGSRSREPHVVPWSDGQQIAPAFLVTTTQSGLAQELGRLPGSPGALDQLARLAFPLTAGEQGPLNAAGIPAVLVQSSGEIGPRAGDAVSSDRLSAYGRGVLRTINALDAGRDVGAPSADVGFGQRVMPSWAIRLLVAILILPVLVAVVDALARARRRRERVGAWVRWALTIALPFLVVAVFAWLLGHTGILRAAPSQVVAPQNLPVDAGGRTALVSVLLVFTLAWLVRPHVARALGLRGAPDEPGAGVAVLVVAVALACFAWIFNPFTAALIVLALHVWLLTLTTELPPPRPLAIALLALALVPLAGLLALDSARLALGPEGLAWSALLLVAGGHVGLFAALGWSVALGCTVAAFLVALNRTRPPTAAEPVTVRGPLTYAGPGSLGGTESALRR